MSGREKQAVRTIEGEPELVKALTERGVNLSSARTILAGIDEAKIHEKIALFDWLTAKKDPRIQKSPAGFLYRSIKENFGLPEDYLAATAQKPRARVPKLVPLQRHTAKRAAGAKQPSDRDAIEQFWKSLGEQEQGRIEQDLVAKAPRFLREQYVEGRHERGILFQTVRQAMIDEYVRELLGVRIAENL